MAQIYNTVSLVAFCLAGVGFLLSLFFWFKFRIPKVISDLSGRTARKSIENMRKTNEKSGAKSFHPSPAVMVRGTVTEHIPGSEKKDDMPRKEQKKQISKQTEEEQATALLDKEEEQATALLNREEEQEAALPGEEEQATALLEKAAEPFSVSRDSETAAETGLPKENSNMKYAEETSLLGVTAELSVKQEEKEEMILLQNIILVNTRETI